MMNSRKLSRLLHDLVDGDATRRRAAADSLAEADERAVYPLIRALRDESPGVQDAAMRSLSGIGGETTAYMTLPLLREDACLRNIAIIMFTLAAASFSMASRPFSAYTTSNPFDFRYMPRIFLVV